MQILATGIDHKSAPVEVRERFSFSGEAFGRFLKGLAETFEEGLILSTCNRTEVYVADIAAHSRYGEVVAFLADTAHLPQDALAPHLLHYRGADAAHHLFAVASGLESMVLGEPQILGQVRCALEEAAATGTAGGVLHRLFREAVRVGKRSRSETDISRYATSVGYAAVEMARRIFRDLRTRSVLLIGAGKMAELTAKTLADNGVEEILVVNRTYEKACELARRFRGRALEFDALADALAACHVVISSTGAEGFVLEPGLLRRVMAHRGHRPLFLIDIAVPRDVDPKVAELENVFLCDIDDLQAVCRGNLRERHAEARRVRVIVEEEAQRFMAWLETLKVVPTVTALRSKAEEIRRAELDKALRHLGDLSQRERNVVNALTVAIVNKLLHSPVTQLKASAGEVEGVAYARAVERLFGLGDALSVEISQGREASQGPAVVEGSALLGASFTLPGEG